MTTPTPDQIARMQVSDDPADLLDELGDDDDFAMDAAEDDEAVERAEAAEVTRLLLIELLDAALRHGSHDQSDHGNRGTPDVTPRMQRQDDGSPGEQVRELVAMSAEPDDGFSVDPQTGEWPEDGYMVGGEGPEVEVTSGDPDDEAEAVQRYIETQGQALSGDDQYLGGWRRPRDGAFVVDASKNVSDEREAARLAVERSEDAVFDVDNLEVVETEVLADRYGIER